MSSENCYFFPNHHLRHVFYPIPILPSHVDDELHCIFWLSLPVFLSFFLHKWEDTCRVSNQFFLLLEITNYRFCCVSCSSHLAPHPGKCFIQFAELFLTLLYSCMLLCCSVRGTSDQSYPPWPGWMVTTLLSYLTTGGLCKEWGTNKLPLTWRIWKRSEGESRYQSLCATIWNPSWLSDTHTTRKDPESGWLAEVNLEANSIAAKPEAANHTSRAVLLGSLALPLSAEAPLPSKVSCCVSTCVSSGNLFPSARQEPILGPWKGSSFLPQYCLYFMAREEKFRHRTFSLPFGLLCPFYCALCICILHWQNVPIDRNT